MSNHGVSAVTLLGDQDGMAPTSWLLGSPQTQTEAATLVLFFDVRPWTGEINADADAHRLGAAAPQDAAGSAVIAPGDLNGDGFDDLVISATMAESTAPGPFTSDEETYINAGAVYVLNGPIIRDIFLDDADGIHVGEHDNAHAGSTLAAGGDLSGDGFPTSSSAPLTSITTCLTWEPPTSFTARHYSGSLSDANAFTVPMERPRRYRSRSSRRYRWDGTENFVGADRANEVPALCTWCLEIRLER